MTELDGDHPRPVGELHAVVNRNVRALMSSSGLGRQSALAETVGMSRSQLSRKLAGREGWTLLDLERLADAFGINPGELLSASEQASAGAA